MQVNNDLEISPLILNPIEFLKVVTYEGFFQIKLYLKLYNTALNHEIYITLKNAVGLHDN